MSSTIRPALDEWKAARALLATTIQSYRAASTTLRAIYTLHVHRPPERSLVEELFLTINSELGSLAAEEDALYDIRLSLAATRNESSTLVRVNTLPPEILARIFALSKEYCVYEEECSFQNFAGVCAYWRRIAIHTADLWTHVDIGPGTSVDLTKLLLERTKDLPIHLHLFEPVSQTPSNCTPEYETRKETAVLKPHIHRVCNLEMESHRSSDNFMRAMLNLWLTSGNHNLARSLLVSRPFAKTVLSYGEPSETAKIINRSENAREVLQSLSRLRLHDTEFGWDSGLYRGLVDLRLSYLCGGVSISVSQLANILAANPALHTLRLSGLRVTHQENWGYPSPIALSCLRFLNLISLDEYSLQLTLPLIGLPALPTELNIAFISSSPMDQVLENFLAYSNATRLYWHHPSTHITSDWTSVVRLLPRLRNLVLRNFCIDDVPAARANRIVSRPSVILLKCTVTLEGLRALVEDYGIRDLRLGWCVVGGEGGGSLRNIRTSLLETYPGLKCMISNTESASQWVYGDWDV